MGEPARVDRNVPHGARVDKKKTRRFEGRRETLTGVCGGVAAQAFSVTCPPALAAPTAGDDV